MTTSPFERLVDQPLTIAGANNTLYALRDDGAVFVLIKAGTLLAGKEVADPYWAACPAVPGTIAAAKQEG